MARTKSNVRSKYGAGAGPRPKGSKPGKPKNDEVPAAPPAEDAAPAAIKKRRKDRHRIIRNMKKLQKETSANKLVPMMSFCRTARAVAKELTGSGVRFSPNALGMLREAALAHVVDTLRNGNVISIVNGSQTLTAPALKAAILIQRQADQRFRVCA